MLEFQPKVAKVTEYGTVLALSPGVTTITARLKSNTNLFSRIQITVNADNSGQIKMVDLRMDYRPDNNNGTEVLVLGQPQGGNTIHSGYTRAICFAENNQFPSIDDFVWHSSNPSVATILNFGMVCGQNVEKPTFVDIIGVNKYNNYIRAKITLVIVPNN